MFIYIFEGFQRFILASLKKFQVRRLKGNNLISLNFVTYFEREFHLRYFCFCLLQTYLCGRRVEEKEIVYS